MTDGSAQLDGLAEEFFGSDQFAEEQPFPEDAYQDDLNAEQADEQPVEDAPPARDYEAEIAAERAKAEAAAQRAEQYERAERERMQREAVTMQQQWAQATQQAKQHAQTLPYDEAINYMESFYAQREQALMQWGTDNFNNLQQTQLTRQAEKLVREHGLSDADTESLVRAAMASGDPNAMVNEATRIKSYTSTKDQEISALKARLERLEKQGQQRQRVNSGINRVGGQNGRPLPRDVKPGSKEHLLSELGDDFLRQFAS